MVIANNTQAADLSKHFDDYGRQGKHRRYPSGLMIARKSSDNPGKLHKAPQHLSAAANKAHKFGLYGPVIITILEDHQELVLNFLSTIEKFFQGKTNEQGFAKEQFLAGSPVYVVWGTSPEDLKKQHQTLVRNLAAQGCPQEQINYLNILDYNTNLRQPDGSMMAAGQAKGEAGGLQAMRYLAQYYRNNPGNASLLQTSYYNTEMDQASRAVFAETDPHFKFVYNTEESVHHPPNWQLATERQQPKLQMQLTNMWEEPTDDGSTQIPVACRKLLWERDYNKIHNATEALATTNEPLIKVLQAFDQLIRETKPHYKPATNIATQATNPVVTMC